MLKQLRPLRTDAAQILDRSGQYVGGGALVGLLGFRHSDIVAERFQESRTAVKLSGVKMVCRRSRASLGRWRFQKIGPQPIQALAGELLKEAVLIPALPERGVQFLDEFRVVGLLSPG